MTPYRDKPSLGDGVPPVAVKTDVATSIELERKIAPK
jgi:hypothetical protein